MSGRGGQGPGVQDGAAVPPGGTVALDAPTPLPALPVLPEPGSAVAGLAMLALPVASGAGALVMALGRPGSPLAIGALVVLVASVLAGGLLLLGQRHSARARLLRQRRRYLSILDAVDRELARDADQARTSTPQPRPGGPGAGPPRVRIGTATASRPVPAPQRGPDELAVVDPVCSAAVADLRSRRGVAHGLPLRLDLSACTTVVIRGAVGPAESILRAMVLDLARSVPPSRLAVVVLGGASESWVRWLPQCSLTRVAAGRVGTVALTGDLVDPTDDPVPRLLSVPGLLAVVVVDFRRPPTEPGAALPADHDPRILRWRLGSHADRPPGVSGTVIDVQSDGGLHVWSGRSAITGRGDGVSADQARMMARAMAGTAQVHPRASSAAGADPDRGSESSVAGSSHLRVVIGHTTDGGAVDLDLKDAAQGGMGPHGIVVGATGAGKSELLRTLTLRLVQRHGPDELTLLLVDYKGGATFDAFTGLPHVAGSLTNLAGDDGLVERFATALAAESRRRQAALARAGVADVTAYRHLTDPPETLPTLLVVVDEYAELLTAHPDLAELFVRLGRTGRSLGLHLLLATQRLDAGRSRGIDGHLSYRIVLRTFTAGESQELLGTTEAFRLPGSPGHALLAQAGHDPLRFRVDRCDQPVTASRRDTPTVRGPRPFPLAPHVLDRLDRLTSLRLDPSAAPPPTPTREPLPAAVDDAGRHWSAQQPARQVWLPPLPSRVTIDHLPGPEPDDHRDGNGGNTDTLRVSFGVLDLPAQQRQPALTWRPAADGNLLITGAGRTGRSNALLTLVAAAGLVAGPGTVVVHAVALAGSTLVTARDWPHVAGVASGDDPDFARRLLHLVTAEIERREALTRRELGRPGPLTDRPAGDGGLTGPGSDTRKPSWPLVLLVVDDWTPGGAPDDDLDDLIAGVARRGPAVGVVTAVALSAGAAARGRVAASFPHRVELRSTESFDSAIDRSRAAALPTGVPGRALVTAGYAQIAVPSEQTSDRLHDRWAGRRVRRRRPLPTHVRLSDVVVRPPAPVDSSGTLVALGVEESGGPAVHHLVDRSQAHLLVLGDPGSGRTTVLRALAEQVAASVPTPLVAAIDLRGTLTGPERPSAAPATDDAMGPAAAGIAWAAAATRRDQVGLVADAVLRHLEARHLDARHLDARHLDARHLDARHLDQRHLDQRHLDQHGGRPDPDGDPRPSPAPVWLFVDDEDLLSGGALHPLAALTPALRSGGDIGLHLVIARGCGGYSRARFEPLHQLLGDLQTPTLLLSGSADEGRLHHRLLPRALPPGRAQWAVRGRPVRLVQTPQPGERFPRNATGRSAQNTEPPVQ